MPTWLLIIILNGIVAVLFALFAYIWRNMEDRVKKIENKDELITTKQVEHPVLTVESHTALCTKNTVDLRSFVEISTNHILTKLDEGEKRTALLIENAILKAAKDNHRVKK